MVEASRIQFWKQVKYRHKLCLNLRTITKLQRLRGSQAGGKQTNGEYIPIKSG